MMGLKLDKSEHLDGNGGNRPIREQSGLSTLAWAPRSREMICTVSGLVSGKRIARSQGEYTCMYNLIANKFKLTKITD